MEKKHMTIIIKEKEIEANWRMLEILFTVNYINNHKNQACFIVKIIIVYLSVNLKKDLFIVYHRV